MSNLSTSYGQNLTIAAILRQAARKARILGSGEPLEPGDIEMGTESAMTILQSWQNGSKMFRHVERASLALTPGTASYGSSDGVTADIIDIVFPAALVDSNGSRFPVSRMTYSEYMQIADTTTTGIPTRVMVERQDEVRLVFDPVPNSQSATFQYVKHRLVRNVEAGKNVDLYPQYLRALILQLAIEYADHYRQPESLLQRLQKQFDDEMGKVKADATEPGDISFRVDF